MNWLRNLWLRLFPPLAERQEADWQWALTESETILKEAGCSFDGWKERVRGEPTLLWKTADGWMWRGHERQPWFRHTMGKAIATYCWRTTPDTIRVAIYGGRYVRDSIVHELIHAALADWHIFEHLANEVLDKRVRGWKFARTHDGRNFYKHEMVEF